MNADLFAKGPRVADITLRKNPTDFGDWDRLLALIAEAFAGMEGRIDPPSSLVAMDAAGLRDKAEHEVLLLAFDCADLIGCGFALPEADALHLSKLAVRPNAQRRGVLRQMVHAFSHEAASRSLPALVLQTRVELLETHASFEALGFVRSGGTSHPGYDRITSWTYIKPLQGRARPE